jgi:cytochrome c556
MLKRPGRITLCAIAAAIVVAAPLVAQGEQAAIYKIRHDAYHHLGEAFKTLRDQLRSDSPDVAALKSAAQTVHEASVNQFNWFPAGSGPAPGVKTRAKAEIWSQPQDFAAAQKLFAAEAEKLGKAAAASDVAAVKNQFGAVGKACKNCHDTFRTPED